jgi:hypothetical protein
MRTVRGGSGYLSKEPGTLHFGLEDRVAIERVEILWPSGHRQNITGLQVDRIHQVLESADDAPSLASSVVAPADTSPFSRSRDGSP